MDAFTSSTKICGVCTGFLSGQPFMTSECAHTFHVGCYKHHTSNKNQLTCPVCYTRWTSTNKNNAHPKPTPNSIDSLVKVSSKAAESIAKAAESIAKAQESMGGGTNYYDDHPYLGPYSFYPNHGYTSYIAPSFLEASIDSLEKVSYKAAESIAESIAKARESIAKNKSFEDCYDFKFY